MADESQTPEEEPVLDEAPVPEEAAPAEESEQAAPAEPPAEAPPAETAEEAPPAAAASEPAPAQEPAEPVTPKQRRQRRRASKTAKTRSRAQMTPQERQAERDAERRRKAGMRRSRRVHEREKTREQRSAAPPAEELPALHGEHSGQQKTRQGIVVSDKASKTITVRIDVARRHPRYAKVVRTSTTLHAHDEAGDAHTGDTVVVRESRPLSRSKRWRLVEVLERAK
jgi:small subunit ribosomal protein S17